jgi:hypothetical protein
VSAGEDRKENLKEDQSKQSCASSTIVISEHDRAARVAAGVAAGSTDADGGNHHRNLKA